jgi:hypothetical protein
MNDFLAVIDLWPSVSELAADMGVPYGVAAQWRRRGSIPADRWLSLINRARERGFEGITLEGLAVAAQRRAGLLAAE